MNRVQQDIQCDNKQANCANNGSEMCNIFLPTPDIKQMPETVWYEVAMSCKFITCKQKREDNVISEPYGAESRLLWYTAACTKCKSRVPTPKQNLRTKMSRLTQTFSLLIPYSCVHQDKRSLLTLHWNCFHVASMQF